MGMATSSPPLPTSERPAGKRGASLRVRLVVLLALVLLPATVLLIYAGAESTQSARRDAEAELLRLAELVAASQAQRLADARGLLAFIAESPEVLSGDQATCSARLAEIAQLYPAYTGIGASDAQGNLYCSSNVLTTTVN